MKLILKITLSEETPFEETPYVLLRLEFLITFITSDKQRENQPFMKTEMITLVELHVKKHIH